ncbi:MAG: hypothetical protein ACREQ3_20160, partial [Candidatus Binatia bacterium]
MGSYKGAGSEAGTFPWLLLVAGAFLSFRSRRDVWFVVVTAVAIIAASRSTTAVADCFVLTKRRVLCVVGAIVITLALVARIRHISGSGLESALAEKFPVAAAAVVEERGYMGPLYNHYNWGGYLIWRLRNLPVSMDGRSNIHGDTRIERSIETWTGRNGWASDPELTAARLVIAGTNDALASLLRLDARFELVYE